METTIKQQTDTYEIHVCFKCGSQDIQEKFWVNPNHLIDSASVPVRLPEFTNEPEFFCNNCDKLHEGFAIPLEDFINNQD